ncbi:hypothetical protein L3X38_011908 [Prunus dulcis]|uniref:Uncharacterized protein n=1 Tax=Prunus dulcis TaxID=3755 RepID=A0AAD4ZFV7_PRUDU|nr:hypothetical protein L3X38_011908 [Prunus dulcis]
MVGQLCTKHRYTQISKGNWERGNWATTCAVKSGKWLKNCCSTANCVLSTGTRKSLKAIGNGETSQPPVQSNQAGNDVGCLKKPTCHAISMSFTRDAVLFQSRVRGPNSEVGAQICGLPDLPLHTRRSSSSSVASVICPTLPRGARLQLTRRRKGTKMKNSGIDALPKLLGFNCR